MTEKIRGPRIKVWNAALQMSRRRNHKAQERDHSGGREKPGEHGVLGQINVSLVTEQSIGAGVSDKEGKDE